MAYLPNVDDFFNHLSIGIALLLNSRIVPFSNEIKAQVVVPSRSSESLLSLYQLCRGRKADRSDRAPSSHIRIVRGVGGEVRDELVTDEDEV